MLSPPARNSSGSDGGTRVVVVVDVLVVVVAAVVVVGRGRRGGRGGRRGGRSLEGRVVAAAGRERQQGHQDCGPGSGQPASSPQAPRSTDAGSVRPGPGQDRGAGEPGGPGRASQCRGDGAASRALPPGGGPPGRGHPAPAAVRLDDAAAPTVTFPLPPPVGAGRRRPASPSRVWAGGEARCSGAQVTAWGLRAPRGGLEARLPPAIRCRRGSRRCGRPPSPGRPSCLHLALRRCARLGPGRAGGGASARPAPGAPGGAVGTSPWSTAAGGVARPRPPAVGERRGR